MAKKLFVGNLAYALTDDQLSQIFSAYGKVASVNIIKDRFSQRSKGFGFVEFETEEEATAAMQALDGSDQEGRKMVVKEATPRADDNRRESPVAAPAATEEPVAPPVEAPMTDVASPTMGAAVPEAPVTEEAPTAGVADVTKITPPVETPEIPETPETPKTEEAPVEEPEVSPVADADEVLKEVPTEEASEKEEPVKSEEEK